MKPAQLSVSAAVAAAVDMYVCDELLWRNSGASAGAFSFFPAWRHLFACLLAFLGREGPLLGREAYSTVVLRWVGTRYEVFLAFVIHVCFLFIPAQALSMPPR